MIQRWTPDLVPQITLAGGTAAANSIAQAGASIGGGIGHLFDRLAKQKQKDKERLDLEHKRGKMFRGLLDVFQSDPEQKKLNAGLSAQEAEGKAVGLYQKSHMDKMAQDLADDKAKQEAIKSSRRDLASFAEMFAKGLQGGVSTLSPDRQSDYYQNPENYDGPPKPHPQDVLASSLAAYPGAATSEQFDNSFNSIMKTFGGNAASPMVFEEDPLTGHRFARERNTVLPSGINPAKLSGQGKISFKDAPAFEGYDILPTPSGGFQYRAKNKKPPFDISNFDQNGDGELSKEEAQQAQTAWALNQSGMPYSGQKVTKPGAAGPAANPKDPLGLFK